MSDNKSVGYTGELTAIINGDYAGDVSLIINGITYTFSPADIIIAEGSITDGDAIEIRYAFQGSNTVRWRCGLE